MDAGLNETRMKMLGELAEMALVLARDLQQAALNAETAEDKVRLADAFQKVGRGVRQSLALHARIERDAGLRDREARAETIREAESRVRRRKAQVKAAVERLIWTEYETSDAEPLLDALDDHLDEAELHDDFLAEEVDTHIAKVCRELQLPDPPLRGRWPEGPEGVAAHHPIGPAPQPPQSLRDSSPSGGASGRRSTA